MQSIHNIEKSAFRKGEYVGYAEGRVYRIKRDGSVWFGMNQDGTSAGSFLQAKTLLDFSRKLTQVAEAIAAERRKERLPNPFTS